MSNGNQTHEEPKIANKYSSEECKASNAVVIPKNIEPLDDKLADVNIDILEDTDDTEDPVKEQHITKTLRESLTLTLAPYSSRRSLITTERINELRRKAQEAAKHNRIFTIRGCFNSVRVALILRGWVEKLDVHRKHIPSIQVSYDELTQKLPKRKAGETRRHYIAKCERNIMSRFLEHIPIDFLWTNRKEKCDYIDQARNPGMIINKFHRAPFTTKEGLCNQLKDFHWFFEEGTAELYFPRCFNVWSPEELSEFIENFKLTACIAFIRFIVKQFQQLGFDGIFASTGKIPYTAIDFAYKRCEEYLESCQHNDIDSEDPPKIWEHDWDAFLQQHYQIVNENGRILSDQHRNVESFMKHGTQLLDRLQNHWPQYSLDGYQNLWIIKPANKCRGRGIVLMDSLKKILSAVNPSIASKSRYVVQKYIERPLILFQTKFDIRQWFLITNVQPLVVWIYKESYLRFSSQEYSLSNHHESVHLTNHAIQKKYTNGKRDKRLPSENMWDCYSFQAYLRQIGKHGMWQERIYPGMKKAIVGTLLASQDNMDRRPNTFELFGADFMICENFYPWLIEINSSPDLGATTSVTARMCPQCLEDVVKVVIDRRVDAKTDLGNFELAYRQVVPQTPAYMGLNLYVKGKQLHYKGHHHNDNHNLHISTRLYNHTQSQYRQRAATTANMLSKVHRVMPVFNATEMVEKYYTDAGARRSSIGATSALLSQQLTALQYATARCKSTLVSTVTPNANLLMQQKPPVERKRSITHEARLRAMVSKAVTDATNEHIKERIRRQRSCGPRLNSAKSDAKAKKAQAKHCKPPLKQAMETTPRTTMHLTLNGKPARCSKSETSLLELLKNTKSTLCQPLSRQKGASNQDLRQTQLSTQDTLQTKCLSDCDSLAADCKWRKALRKTPMKQRTATASQRESSHSPRTLQPEIDTQSQPQQMHAKGKNLSSCANVSVVVPKIMTTSALVGTTCNSLPVANELLTMRQLVSPRPLKARYAQSNN